jgi:hypothetical protein
MPCWWRYVPCLSCDSEGRAPLQSVCTAALFSRLRRAHGKLQSTKGGEFADFSASALSARHLMARTALATYASSPHLSCTTRSMFFSQYLRRRSDLEAGTPSGITSPCLVSHKTPPSTRHRSVCASRSCSRRWLCERWSVHSRHRCLLPQISPCLQCFTTANAATRDLRWHSHAQRSCPLAGACTHCALQPPAL